MKHTTIAALIAASVGCAHTTFYQAGQPTATFQGDMTGMRYTRTATGDVTWESAKVNHSAATTAQGLATTQAITATGAATAASILPRTRR